MRDPYDIRVVFDDVERPVDPKRGADAIRRIVCASQAAKIAAPVMFESLSHDPTADSFKATGVSLVGADTNIARLPVLSRLVRAFSTALPAPKVLRVDTEKTYRDFRDVRRVPYIMDFERKVSEDADVLGALEEVLHAGNRVPLSLPPWAQGKIDCWQDGPEILCTIRVLAPDNTLRLMTTGSPLDLHLDETALFAKHAGLDPLDAEPVIPLVARMAGGGSLISQLCRAYPVVAERPEVLSAKPSVGVVAPTADPLLAATMALLQKSQRSDGQAALEVAEMQRRGLGKTVGEAAERLAQGQALKALNSRSLS
jgi:hypothetical protein